jgi:pyruvate formate lyase activating enzyme
VDRLLLDRPFFEDSGGGVTFTGGEPTSQSEFLLEALELLKGHGVHTAIETCGHFRSSLCEPLAERVDLFLFDLKNADPEIHKEGTGVGNKLIFENLQRLVSLVGTDRIVPRLPLVPGFSDSSDAVGSLLCTLEGLGFDGEVHLMPYHDWARHKHVQLGLEFRDRGRLDPSVRDLTDALFEGRELQAVWGGGA